VEEAAGSLNAKSERAMRRVVVIGSSGAGKTTLAQELAARLGVPHVELDALHWGPNWTSTPTEILRSRVEAAIAGDGWTVSGNYLKLRDSIWPRADTLIWLDYPMPLVMWRVVRRTVGRCITKERLWADNVESWRVSFFDKESIIVWAWTTWRKQRRDYPKLFRLPAYRGIRKYRFTSPKQTRDWLNRVEFANPHAQHH
jgi:adenylate kinase family enzyme